MGCWQLNVMNDFVLSSKRLFSVYMQQINNIGLARIKAATLHLIFGFGVSCRVIDVNCFGRRINIWHGLSLNYLKMGEYLLSIQRHFHPINWKRTLLNAERLSQRPRSNICYFREKINWRKINMSLHSRHIKIFNTNNLVQESS